MTAADKRLRSKSKATHISFHFGEALRPAEAAPCLLSSTSNPKAVSEPLLCAALPASRCQSPEQRVGEEVLRRGELQGSALRTPERQSWLLARLAETSPSSAAFPWLPLTLQNNPIPAHPRTSLQRQKLTSTQILTGTVGRRARTFFRAKFLVVSRNRSKLCLFALSFSYSVASFSLLL